MLDQNTAGYEFVADLSSSELECGLLTIERLIKEGLSAAFDATQRPGELRRMYVAYRREQRRRTVADSQA